MNVFGKLNHKNGFRRFQGQTVKGKRFFKYQIAFKTNNFEEKFLGQTFTRQIHLTQIYFKTNFLRLE